ncbi:TPA: hypothetical protein N0F65_011293 [Lagenidium giganteum]|uniref:Uncharacterized protein n=1 Tax=Lagenidium giganteum TaxID=4803 RepID=A0AAV2YXZ2_9STRA|nr:TPA: hypothetical protein N0F65_011293 [Lagenidium giganteum]
MAAKITVCSVVLNLQLQRLQQQLENETEEIGSAEDDLQEAQGRLVEIDMYMHELRDEMQALEAEPEHDQERMQGCRQEYKELEQERAEEVELLSQMSVILGMHRRAAANMLQVRQRLARELELLKQKEKLLAMVALRCRMVKVASHLL